MNIDDIDQDLLHQFSCMGTTDKDILVTQLQTLVGTANKAAATFFLDMNNWNLQAAICSYFDYEAPNSLPCMALVKDLTVGEGESVPPNTNFTKTWRIRNTGVDSWPDGCILKMTVGGLSGTTEVPVPALGPADETDINVSLKSPLETGTNFSTWRLCTPAGFFFGDTIWAVVQVDEGGTLAVTQQLNSLSSISDSTDQIAASNNQFKTFYRT